MSTPEERYPPSAASGPKHSRIEVTSEEQTHLDEIVATFMHAEEYVRDAVLNMLKLLPHIPAHQRVAHLEAAYAVLIGDGLHSSCDVLDDRFVAGLRVTANYLNLDPDQFEARARRGRLVVLN